jgi:hypothetical protein
MDPGLAHLARVGSFLDRYLFLLSTTWHVFFERSAASMEQGWLLVLAPGSLLIPILS